MSRILSTRGEGAHTSVGRPGQTPPRQTPHSTDTTSPKMATAADGTHPTGMHSCLMWILDLWNTFVSMPRAYSDRYHCLHCVLLDGEHKTSTGIRLTFTWERACIMHTKYIYPCLLFAWICQFRVCNVPIILHVILAQSQLITPYHSLSCVRLYPVGTNVNGLTSIKREHVQLYLPACLPPANEVAGR